MHFHLDKIYKIELEIKFSRALVESYGIIFCIKISSENQFFIRNASVIVHCSIVSIVVDDPNAIEYNLK